MHYNWQTLVYMDATLFSQTTSSSDNSVKFTASPSTIGLQKDNIMQNSPVAKNSSSSRGEFFRWINQLFFYLVFFLSSVI